MNIHGSYQVSCNPTKKVVAEEKRVWIHGKSRSGFPLRRRVRLQCLGGAEAGPGSGGSTVCWFVLAGVSDGLIFIADVFCTTLLRSPTVMAFKLHP